MKSYQPFMIVVIFVINGKEMEKKTLLDNLTEKQKQYDFSLIEDSFKYNAPLDVICHHKDALGREHCVFKTIYNHLLRGDGCPKCNGKYMDKELFVYEAKQIHGNDCSYDESVFLGKKKKMQIYCNIHKIFFPQTPEKHLLGQSCPLCRYDKSSKTKTKSLEEFIKQSNITHNGKYDTSKAVYKGYNTSLTLICHEKDENGIEHGEFEITPSNHLRKTKPQGCPICGRISSSLSRVKPFEDFEHEANIIHNNKYKYVKDTYINASSIVDIICPIHGWFPQKGTDHTCLKQGCPKCSNQMSSAEDEIYEFLKEMLPTTQIERRNRTIIAPQELDIVVPSHNMAIEFDGLVWHSTKFNKDKQYHLVKTGQCLNKGITLIHIFEDEWNNKKDIVKSILRNAFDYCEKTINADDCEIKPIEASTVRDFLKENSLFKYNNSNYRYGLYRDNGDLLSVITFGKYNKETKSYEILNYSNKLNINVENGLDVFVSHFIKEHNPSTISVSIDRRYPFTEHYENVGFVHKVYTKPTFQYVDGKHRSKIKPKNNTVYKIYDCGKSIMELLIIK